MNKKLDIFEVLRAIDTGDYDFINQLDDEERKELHKNLSWIIPMWWSASNHPEHEAVRIILTSNHVNPIWNNLRDHPDLQYKILCSLSKKYDIGATRHRFPKRNQKKTNLTEAHQILLKHGVNPFGIEKGEAIRVLEDLGYTEKDVINLARML